MAVASERFTGILESMRMMGGPGLIAGGAKGIKRGHEDDGSQWCPSQHGVPAPVYFLQRQVAACSGGPSRRGLALSPHGISFFHIFRDLEFDIQMWSGVCRRPQR